MGNPLSELGRRERQIMDIVLRRRRASANDVLADLEDPPSYSAVRGMLRLLEEKGYVTREWDGPRHVYQPVGNVGRLRRDALKHVVDTFFESSTESAVVALLGAGGKKLTRDQLDRISHVIDKAKKSAEDE
ncbi:MAG TPA: BlaI/MecI/CopY family transcriptional regulator [Gemmatimonadaceae bacterium]|jgi:predicted transcriptional regulator